MRNVKSVLFAVLATVLVLPAVASAQLVNLGSGGNLKGALQSVMSFLNSYAIPFLIAVAIIYFLWNVLGFIMNAGNDEKRGEYQKGILYGLIGLVVMLSFWGLITFVQNSFGLTSGGGATAYPSAGFPTISN